MKVKEILAMFPNLTRSNLQYWELLGFLKPQVVKKRKLSRRIYTSRDLQIIKAMYPYYNQGFEPQEAYQMAIKDSGSQFTSSNNIVNFKKFYEENKVIADRLMERVFSGEDLSLDEICQRASHVLIREFISVLPIEQTPSGKYRYKPKS